MVADTSSFDLARMEALKEYANLELQLFRLLDVLLDVEAEISSTIFYEIVNTRVRYRIIGGILGVCHSNTFKKAWPKLERWLRPRDEARNRIVHWGHDISTHVIVLGAGAAAITGNERGVHVSETPILSNMRTKWRGEPKLDDIYDEKKLVAERRNIAVMKHIVNRYMLSIMDPDFWPWTDLFQQRIVYSAPEEFLRVLNDRGHPAKLDQSI